jgi:hypothetical protein
MAAEIPLFGNYVLCFIVIRTNLSEKKPGKPNGTYFDGY